MPIPQRQTVGFGPTPRHVDNEAADPSDLRLCVQRAAIRQKQPVFPCCEPSGLSCTPGYCEERPNICRLLLKTASTTCYRILALRDLWMTFQFQARPPTSRTTESGTATATVLSEPFVVYAIEHIALIEAEKDMSRRLHALESERFDLRQAHDDRVCSVTGIKDR
jgi:hypothetical protein